MSSNLMGIDQALVISFSGVIIVLTILVTYFITQVLRDHRKLYEDNIRHTVKLEKIEKDINQCFNKLREVKQCTNSLSDQRKNS